MVAAAFAQRGLNGVHFDARNASSRTATRQGDAAGGAIETQLTEHVLPLLEAGQTPVMGGFIGATRTG